MAIVHDIVLASTSVYRQKILKDAAVPFRVAVSAVDEDQISDKSPAVVARLRAEAKARAVAANEQRSLIIGADQVLGLDGQSYGKAASEDEARQRLLMFAGKTHILHTAYALACHDEGGGKWMFSRVIDVEMRMRTLSKAEIDAYIASGEWQGVAGCYQLEHRGVHLMRAPIGEATAIIGLPLPELLQDLRVMGINFLVQASGPWKVSLSTLGKDR